MAFCLLQKLCMTQLFEKPEPSFTDILANSCTTLKKGVTIKCILGDLANLDLISDPLDFI